MLNVYKKGLIICSHTDWCPYSTQAIEEWPQLLETVAERTKSIRTPSSNTTGDSKDKNAQTFPEIIHVSSVSLSSAILLAAGLNTDRLPFYAVVADGKYLPIDKMSLIDSNIDLAFQDVDNYGLHIKISPHEIRSWQMYIFDTISRYIMHFQRYVAESIGSGALLTHLIISSILVSSLACERLGVFKYL